MKITVIIAVLFCSRLALAQDVKPDSLYIVTYTTGPSWDVAKLPGEQPYFKEHSANLGKLRKDGVITAGARYGDKGIIFIKASSLQAAKEIVFADQAVASKLFNADVQKLNVFYDGCIEKPKKN
jgi:uncharacterized protein YciI